MSKYRLIAPFASVAVMSAAMLVAAPSAAASVDPHSVLPAGCTVEMLNDNTSEPYLSGDGKFAVKLTVPAACHLATLSLVSYSAQSADGYGDDLATQRLFDFKQMNIDAAHGSETFEVKLPTDAPCFQIDYIVGEKKDQLSDADTYYAEGRLLNFVNGCYGDETPGSGSGDNGGTTDGNTGGDTTPTPAATPVATPAPVTPTVSVPAAPTPGAGNGTVPAELPKTGAMLDPLALAGLGGLIGGSVAAVRQRRIR